MVEVRETEDYRAWFARLRDFHARARIVKRLKRLELGNPGDVKPVGEGVSELRIDWGPGYRLYYTQQRAVVVVLLCGGDKTTQSSDIEKAKQMARELEIDDGP